ncbi:MAG TPA: isocitrate/isopropylmalate dehydrogenase family protein [Candidatus Thermoplasmatota archaeon]|nr:isocitrate/isopropylmalate dehydrogenase family protein [Candidatus Thermoplasmatota archaeon]
MTGPRIAVLAGDGIGPEVTAVAVRVLQAAWFQGSFTQHAVGWSEWCARGDPLPAATLRACKEADAVLFGAITSKPETEAQAEVAPHLRGTVRYRSPIVRLRKELDLYANVRPCQGNGMDLVLFREATEGLYAGFEAAAPGPALRAEFPGLPADAAVSLRVVTPGGAGRICEAAFAYARANGRRRVTLVEKANVLRETGGLMRREFRAVAARFPDLVADELHVDAACARVVSHPGDLDVAVATNLFGDILSDVAAEVSGGLPLAASSSLGARHALFEPVHGSAPDIAGRGIANPLGAVRAAAMLARHLGQPEVAGRIEAAVASLLAVGTVLPRDLGGSAGTAQVEAALLATLSQLDGLRATNAA